MLLLILRHYAATMLLGRRGTVTLEVKTAGYFWLELVRARVSRVLSCSSPSLYPRGRMAVGVLDSLGRGVKTEEYPRWYVLV